jgi:1-acyl-sn-glycerol-3-phosphate acyltransferase
MPGKAIRYIYLSYAILVFVVIMLVLLPFIVIPFLFGEIKGGKIAYFFLKVWGWSFFSAVGISYKTLNKEKVRSDQAYIFTCNHRSYLDSITMVMSITGQFRPLGKIEMSKVPVFGIIYKKVVVMVDRSSTESRSKSMKALRTKIHQKISVFIFPEGKMNQTDFPLTSFYDGAFRLAIETQTPIVPLVMLNTAELLPRKGEFLLKPGVITTVFSDPISTAGLTLADTAALKQQVYLKMETLLYEYGAVANVPAGV